MDGQMSAPGEFRKLSLRKWWLPIAAIIVVGVASCPIAAQFKKNDRAITPYRVVADFPHDPAAFSQGLVIVDGQLYEGTGKKGESTLRKVDLKTGRVEVFVPLDRSYFGEGITILNDRIYQLTWENHLGFVYDLKTLKQLRTFRYSGEGWGLANDGKHLIMSDGTAILRFLDPQSFEVVKRVRVRSSQGQVDKLNELEYVKGEILANIWYEDRIARISPETGEVLGWIDLSSLYPARQRSREDVLNGIAYDEASGRLFVTGKNWPKLYEIELLKK